MPKDHPMGGQELWFYSLTHKHLQGATTGHWCGPSRDSGIQWHHQPCWRSIPWADESCGFIRSLSHTHFYREPPLAIAVGLANIQAFSGTVSHAKGLSHGQMRAVVLLSLSHIYVFTAYCQALSKHCFPAPSSKLCQIWLRYWRGTLYLRAAVHRCGQHPPKGLGTDKTVVATLRPSTHVNMRRIHPR